MAVAVGLADAVLLPGTEYRTSFFYLIPVVLVAWQADVPLALAMGVVSVGAWLMGKQFLDEITDVTQGAPKLALARIRVGA
ncbi:MAG: hypothetical protein WCI11_21285, partial [Candidatus Methylumidiphilus sp.]